MEVSLDYSFREYRVQWVVVQLGRFTEDFPVALFQSVVYVFSFTDEFAFEASVEKACTVVSSSSAAP